MKIHDIGLIVTQLVECFPSKHKVLGFALQHGIKQAWLNCNKNQVQGHPGLHRMFMTSLGYMRPPRPPSPHQLPQKSIS